MNRCLLAGVTLVLAVGAACTSAAVDTTTTTTAATTTTSTSTTTTTAPAPTTTTAAVAVEVPAGPVSLPAYLGLTFRLDGRFTEAIFNASLNATPEDPLAGQVEAYEEYVTTLSRIEPPDEAAAYHAQILSLMQRALDTTRDAQAMFDSGDPAATQEAAEELVSMGEEMIGAGFTLAGEQQAVVAAFLDGRDDPESRYILDLLSLQSSDSLRDVETLLTEATAPDITFEELAVLYRDIVGLYEVLLAGYREVDPPESWQDLYDRQVELLEDGIVVYGAIAESIETDTEPELEVLLGLFDLVERVPAFNAELAIRLAEHFETLDSPLVTGSLPPMPRGAPGDRSAAGLAAPVISGYDFDGRPVMIQDDGRAKAIVFLAHWCVHCRAEVPRVQEWLDETGGVEGVDLYSVATAIEPARDNYPPSRWLRDEGWTVPLVRDHLDNPILDAYGNGGFPFWVFTNSDGTVALRMAGELPIAELEAILGDLG